MKLPYIFIFKLNNNIIGNIKYIFHEYEILNIYHNICKKKNILNNCIKKFDIREELLKGELRPYFKNFIDLIKKKYKNVEFYIYSDFTYKLLNSGIIENIEEIIDIKFNKPYFSNEYINFKNMNEIIIKDLINKYPSLKYKKNQKNVLENQLIYLHNIKNDNEEKQIICPEYNFTYYYNMKEKLIKKYDFKEDDFNNEELLKYFNNNGIPFYYDKGSKYQQDNIYQSLLEMIEIRKYDIDNNKDDIFYKNLII